MGQLSGEGEELLHETAVALQSCGLLQLSLEPTQFTTPGFGPDLGSQRLLVDLAEGGNHRALSPGKDVLQ